MSAKDANETDKTVSKKMKTKNSLRGGYPIDNPTQVSIFIEQAFSSTQIVWICRNDKNRFKGPKRNFRNDWKIY